MRSGLCAVLLVLLGHLVQAAEEQTWTSADGTATMRYAVDLPAKPVPGQPLGLILGCHGSGGGTDAMNRIIVNGLQRVGLASRFLVVGIHSSGTNWSPEVSGDASQITDFVAWAKTNWPIDARRVFMYGFSAGGWITIKMQAARPDIFAGGACWGSSDHWLKEDHAATAAPIYWINGTADALQNPKAAGERAEKLITQGFPIVHRNVTGMGHDAYADVPGDDVFRWFDALRNPNIPLSEAERAFLEQTAARQAEGKAVPVASLERLADLAGPEVDKVLIQLAQSAKREQRLAAARLCQVRLYGAEVQQALIVLVTDKETTVRHAALRALGVAANWNRMQARDALVVVAKDAAAKPADRVMAAGQLALAAVIQRACSNQDAVLFDTLRALLTDKSTQLRVVAQAGLDGQVTSRGDDIQLKP